MDIYRKKYIIYIIKGSVNILDLNNNRGCDYIIHILEIYRTDSIIVELELGLLSCISLRDTSNSIIPDCTELLITILRLYTDKEKIQQYGMELVSNLCADSI